LRTSNSFEADCVTRGSITTFPPCKFKV
jgi:hypothetical protein